jgi:[ribosomal protein S5]-alanine N-acetyltransferase
VRPLLTERLVVREFTLDDLDGLAALYGDPRVLWWEPLPFSREKTEAVLRETLKRYRDDGIGEYAAVRRADGVLVGQCGPVSREIEGESLPELGWDVRSDLWGRGYATEAATAVVGYLGRHTGELGLTCVYSLIRDDNPRSRRVALKLGMTIARRVMWADHPHDLWALDLLSRHDAADAHEAPHHA